MARIAKRPLAAMLAPSGGAVQGCTVHIEYAARRRAAPATTMPWPDTSLTAGAVLLYFYLSIKSAGVRPAPNLSRTKVGTGV
jgi:hypothetical protein